MKKVSVIGAGIGGLASAILLSKKGFDVTVFEKNENTGGKMNQIYLNNFRFDIGPSLITMPFVLEEFFKEAGREISDYITLKRLKTNCKYFYPDGTVFNAYNDSEKFREEIENIFGKTTLSGFDKYFSYSEKLYNLSANSFLYNPFSLKKFFNIEGLLNAGKFLSSKSLHKLHEEFISDKIFIQYLDRFATYNGSNPYLAPALFSIIPYVEIKFGGYYIENGIYKLAESLVKICKEENIPIKSNSRFLGLEEKDKKIKVIKIGDSEDKIENVEQDYVVSNITNDISLTGSKYLGNSKWSMSGFILLLSVSKTFPELEHHNILFSEDYKKEFDELSKDKKPSEDMTVYISISSKSSPADAPENCENWFVLVNVPNLLDYNNWSDEFKESYKEKIFTKIEKSGFKIREYILNSKILTPCDLAQMYGTEYGSLYGLASDSLNLMMKRPKNKSSKYKNLFFACGSSHPGGGVPLCFLSGKIVSKLIVK